MMRSRGYLPWLQVRSFLSIPEARMAECAAGELAEIFKIGLYNRLMPGSRGPYPYLFDENNSEVCGTRWLRISSFIKTLVGCKRCGKITIDMCVSCKRCPMCCERYACGTIGNYPDL